MQHIRKIANFSLSMVKCFTVHFALTGYRIGEAGRWRCKRCLISVRNIHAIHFFDSHRGCGSGTFYFNFTLKEINVWFIELQDWLGVCLSTSKPSVTLMEPWFIPAWGFQFPFGPTHDPSNFYDSWFFTLKKSHLFVIKRYFFPLPPTFGLTSHTY